MIRPVETLTERTLLEEGILEVVDVGKLQLAKGVRVRVGPGQAEEQIAKVLPQRDLVAVDVDETLEGHEWAPVWEGRPREARCEGCGVELNPVDGAGNRLAVRHVVGCSAMAEAEAELRGSSFGSRGRSS